MKNTWLDRWNDVHDDDLNDIAAFFKKNALSIVSGGVLAEFEECFARFNDIEYAAAFNNGTAALHAALWAVGVRAGDNVLICDYGFHGMAAAALSLGARVVPCDCHPHSLTMDPAKLSSYCSDPIKAIMVHHPWGVPAEIDKIRQALPGAAVISDASHAHGAEYNDLPLAKWADITCFSLGLGKLISGGELGCCVTGNPELRDLMMIYGHVNRVPGDLLKHDWQGNAVGLKFRPHPLAMVIAMAQMRRFAEKQNRLLNTCGQLEKGFAAAGFIPQEPPPGARRTYWRLVFKLDEEIFSGIPTSLVEETLAAAGIPVQKNHYWPLLQDQDIFKWEDNKSLLSPRKCPVARQVVPRTITLPAPVDLPPETIAEAAEEARKLSKKNGLLRGKANKEETT